MSPETLPDRTILWRRLDLPGHESARLTARDSSWLLEGTAVFLHAGSPCRLDYRIVCDARWRTRSGRVTGWAGDQAIDVECAADGEGGWRLDGAECPAVAGCVDIDLNFSPSTNLLPIRRLGLAVGEEAAVRAAWLRFPSFALEPLEQVYRRLGSGLYRYESAGGSFAADLQVNDAGFVTTYPNLWQSEAAGGPGPRELIRAWVDAFNRADVDALAAFYAEGATNHQVAESPVHGRVAIREMFARGFASAKMVCIVENIFEEGEWGILEWRDPLGLRGCGFFHVVDGRISFQRGYWDKLSFLRSQGLPLPESL